MKNIEKDVNSDQVVDGDDSFRQHASQAVQDFKDARTPIRRPGRSSSGDKL